MGTECNARLLYEGNFGLNVYLKGPNDCPALIGMNSSGRLNLGAVKVADALYVALLRLASFSNGLDVIATERQTNSRP